jgi:hypothetical protein
MARTLAHGLAFAGRRLILQQVAERVRKARFGVLGQAAVNLLFEQIPVSGIEAAALGNLPTGLHDHLVDDEIAGDVPAYGVAAAAPEGVLEGDVHDLVHEQPDPLRQ